MLTYQFGNGVDGSGDQLAFEDDDVRGVALQREIQIVEVFYLGDDADVILKGEDLPDSDTIDGLRIGQHHSNSSWPRVLLESSLLRSILVAPGFVKMNNRHKSGL